MSLIVGKIKSIIYHNESNGYLVAIFRVSKVSDESLDEYLKKSITITGTFLELKMETLMELNGEFISHEKFGKQFKVNSYELVMPKENDDIIEFLSSSFVKGCGKKTAEKIVEIYGSESIDIIKENKFSLDKIDGMSDSKREKIYESLINYSKSSDVILKLKNLGFSIEESGKIYSKYRETIVDILENNIYLLNEIVDFKRLDGIFLNNYKDKYDKRRVKACILESMKAISLNTGDIYYEQPDVFGVLSKLFSLNIDYETYIEYLEELENDLSIVINESKCYLQENFQAEMEIAKYLKNIDAKSEKNYDYEEAIEKLESKLQITYNDDQKKAIKTALNNNITIISGGPGTGKTTIINAIVKLYIEKNRLNNIGLVEQIALLAPTGRAAKKMSTSTGLPASTIHRYLKWNKDHNDFMINENNKNFQRLIIVDEVSMIDTNLFAALLKGVHSYVKLILVGDAFQLPSVGPGLVLSDLINSDLFNYVPLNYIYRQSENSYIPYLAREIKNKDLCEEFTQKRDDYNFIMTDNKDIRLTIKKIIEAGITKGYDENNLQILAPMYKGENGIDNLNKMLCDIFNPNEGQRQITYGEIIYKEGDKVLQLVNDADNNVFNGDIGFIKSISTISNPYKKDIVTIDYDGNIVLYQKKDLKNIRHAYAITIHKSQGSEFDHVIMPITYHYGNMLYNKILYTGVSRAKKSLILIGDASSFYKGVLNDYGTMRKTTLQEKLMKEFIHN
ncbi:MAG: ATP-dependent RecD-like DNA helicase [Firmicutes bacterium]|nr:ATP-dependent RecD-like DNA helicase [Bacillota bacterium]